MIFRHCYKNFKRSSSCLFVEFRFRATGFLNRYLFFVCSSEMNGIFLREETVPLCVFPSVLIISLFIMLKKICCNFKKRRCILGENMLLFWWREGVVFPLCRFLQIMRCIFPRAHAPARAINKYYCACFPPPSAYAEKICRVTYLFSSALRKNFEEKSKKSRVKVGVCEKVRNFAPAFERETQ